MVGVLAGFSVYLFASLFPSLEGWEWTGAVWALFISWGGWFSVGAKNSRLLKYILALTGGVVFGILTLYVYLYVLKDLLGDTWGLPVTVFLAATLIVLLELTSWFEIAFVYFLAYAGYFAYVLGGVAGGIVEFGGTGTIIGNAVYFWILLMAGLAFALVNVWLKNILFKVERVPLDARNTIFDKE
jgi:hypothetical protein